LARLAYFLRSLRNQFTPDRFHCPNCGSEHSTLLDRKFLVTQLRRCAQCRLMFRTPTDDLVTNFNFYENEYEQGFTTDTPSDAALAELKRTKFAGTQPDYYSYYIHVLTQLGLKPGARVFDYGCSWGYGSYQLAEAGFQVCAFEIAPGRSRYAREKLHVQMVDDMDCAALDLAARFDCFFSAHVLEHLPSIAQSFDYAMRLLKPHGLFVSFTPNGSESFRAASPSDWHTLWSEAHPNLIDDAFLDRSFQLSPRAVGSSPVSNASLPDKPQIRRLNKVDGCELFFAARKNGET
jgi:2-polyprenyl-3-methyl-5-hydroxy-6-metoxy-1,4-benzoquinol methylase